MKTEIIIAAVLLAVLVWQKASAQELTPLKSKSKPQIATLVPLVPGIFVCEPGHKCTKLVGHVKKKRRK